MTKQQAGVLCIYTCFKAYVHNFRHTWGYFLEGFGATESHRSWT